MNKTYMIEVYVVLKYSDAKACLETYPAKFTKYLEK